ncbi:hypothetical protein Tco_1399781 [Tanacetum coccineum]
MMKAHLAQTKPVQVNKIASSCEICNGPYDTQYCMEDPEQAFVEYASTHHGVTPSDTVKNPKLNTNPTSSARSHPARDPQSSSNSFKSVNDIQTCFKSNTCDKKDQFQVNTLMVLEVLAHVPMYDALLDKYIVSLEVGENGSEYIQSIAPEKMKDLGLFILPCRLGDSKPFDTLADLGSCVNLLLLKLFKDLKVGLLEETNDVLGLANGTKSYPMGL